MERQQGLWLADLKRVPVQPPSRKAAASVISDMKTLGADHPSVPALTAGDSTVREGLVAVFSLSPFLRETALAHPSLVADLLARPIDGIIDEACLDARESWRPDEGGAPRSDGEVMAALRRAKRKVAFALAIADLLGLVTGAETTRYLSAFADAAVSATVDHLLLSADAAGKIRLEDRSEPSRQSGLIVLGMGKHGACELNYSSDIDLVIFYDPEVAALAARPDLAEDIARLLRRLIRILQERTGDGYVFRTDLRLRPDPGATPLAVSVDAAMTYYEGRGQNWERAAFIKARPVAGDLAAGEAFLKALTPFVFRKYLDFAAIADIHSIKRQIHDHKGHGEIAVKGHNIKLGRGGIREIEFFAQTQQLIAGGRMPELRARSTEGALAALAEARWIDEQTAAALTEAYWFLRNVEHRIQMVHDEQAHTLPKAEAELRRIALMMGFAGTDAFSDALSARLRTVERHYGALFERERSLSDGEGNLVFTGQNDDPETLATLSRLGFARPSDICRMIRTWHAGRYAATQSAEARERLTELTPRLLQAFGESRMADEAMMRFDAFLGRLPAGIQLFSLIASNPALLALIVTIMSAAPRLADIVAARPHVFDGMLDPRLLTELPDRSDLKARLALFLSGARDVEDRLDRLRIFAAEQRFLIGVRLLTGVADAETVGFAFTDLADLCVAAALDVAQDAMAAAHGHIAGASVAVLGLGKLGSREMTAGSDIDLILLYDHPDDPPDSDGARPLDAPRYFARLAQRLIASLSAPTSEGVLYPVDMRLRPSGNKGPLATRLSAFEKYQREDAWTWEHMALTRARGVAGDGALLEKAASTIARVLDTPREPDRLTRDIAEMRGLIAQEKRPYGLWDVKLIEGGVVDVEFIAQDLMLSAAANPALRPPAGTPTIAVLRQLGPALLGPEATGRLVEASTLYATIAQVLRLCLEGPFDRKTAPLGLIERLCRASGAPDLSVLEAELRERAHEVRAIFIRHIGRPVESKATTELGKPKL
ncbi:glutamine-synthetase adenylyltransferase [Xaviernesmea oryzae]|uniref:Bifunctional glutamine synthetase adenylyltransferase/adenylyl-removing enzyme n=1 Tax=Xaviernesmea oryzae TaxID=464029 RepID=A0A1Q9B1I6_9HYPH|nr:bifunctional [glutamine synthetase] adenylyltransferase/[glutamine synthetase]-adenylyl-L-tyrosine phosphorylase [Xaviernesmea oryzae]OLP61872.1 glutamine-synthetase adenylyltransferase [Xaviernesmea oryzae]SEL74805.1 glutamate-ammonia-ligase adenylyltransferase [Xaviernesmea oryzae]